MVTPPATGAGTDGDDIAEAEIRARGCRGISPPAAWRRTMLSPRATSVSARLAVGQKKKPSTPSAASTEGLKGTTHYRQIQWPGNDAVGLRGGPTQGWQRRLAAQAVPRS